MAPLRIPASFSDAALTALLDRLGHTLMTEPEALAAALGHHRAVTMGVVLAEVEAAVRDGHHVGSALRLAVLLGGVLQFERDFIGRLLDEDAVTS